ncbi:hypothetical protein A9G31_06635 [Gilliamella sp. Gris1-4]|nr:hypothetical protein A9G31_06635 [Gilliamella apicola]
MVVLTVNACEETGHSNNHSGIKDNDNEIVDFGANFNRKANKNKFADFFERIEICEVLKRFEYLKIFKT